MAAFYKNRDHEANDVVVVAAAPPPPPPPPAPLLQRAKKTAAATAHPASKVSTRPVPKSAGGKLPWESESDEEEEQEEQAHGSNTKAVSDSKNSYKVVIAALN